MFMLMLYLEMSFLILACWKTMTDLITLLEKRCGKNQEGLFSNIKVTRQQEPNRMNLKPLTNFNMTRI